jgi:transposase
MWTRENRGLYERKGARYPSDLRDTEWALIAPLVPPVKGGGRRREVDVREVLNGVLYVPETGCQWRALPKGLPPKSMVHDYLMLWDWDGTLERIHHELYLKTRDLEGCEASLSAGPRPLPPGRSGWSNAPPRPRASRPSPDALVVERTIARINRCRRLAKDDEYLNRTAVAFIRLARIGLMPRRLTRYRYSS